MSSTTVLINTDSGGDFTYERPFFGTVVAIATVLDTLETPTIVISDTTAGNTLRTLTALAADDFWQPGDQIAVFGTLKVEVTGGGDTKHGHVRFMTQT